MSVKLGNTNIAGTQVLYSTTGNNTDGAMTQAATTTALNNKADNSVVNLKANDNAVVHLTGNETISDVKTFNTDIIRTGVFSSNDTNAIRTIDTNGKGVTYLASYYVNGSVYNRLIAINTTANIAGWIEVIVRDDGAIYATAPASEYNGTIVTTADHLKSYNGFYKLGNGLIIQWGRVSNTNNNNITVTFPTQFTSTNYSINAMRTNVNSGYSYDGITGISSRNTTSCVLYSHYGNSEYDWLAIGY